MDSKAGSREKEPFVFDFNGGIVQKKVKTGGVELSVLVWRLSEGGRQVGREFWE